MSSVYTTMEPDMLAIVVAVGIVALIGLAMILTFFYELAERLDIRSVHIKHGATDITFQAGPSSEVEAIYAQGFVDALNATTPRRYVPGITTRDLQMMRLYGASGLNNLSQPYGLPLVDQTYAQGYIDAMNAAPPRYAIRGVVERD
jgi:hypothetical protein